MTDALEARLSDDAAEVRLQAVLQAAAPGDSPAPPALVQALAARLDDEHPGVQQAALESLTRLIEAGRATVGPSALARAVALSRHASPKVRAEAVGALGVFCPEVEDPNRAPRLLAALRDDDPEVRRTAAAACSDLRLTEATEALASALDDPETRFEAAFALAHLGDARARGPLESALANGHTRLDALEALRHLADPAAGPAVRRIAERWLSSWADRLSAWATLHVLGEADAAARVAERATSRRMEERIYALFLLGRYGIAEGRSDIERIARDPRHRDRETAIEALAGYSDAAAVEALAEIARSEAEDTEARRAAIWALGRTDKAQEALQELAAASDASVAEAARAALRSAGRPM